MVDHGLSESQLQVIRAILAPFAESIESVGLFGSRATGRFRPNSDIDMVLYGPIDEAMQDRIATLFDESPLAVDVDVVAYALIAYPALRAHIDAVMRPLFTRAELRDAG